MLAKNLFTLAVVAIFAPLLVNADKATVALYSNTGCKDADYFQTLTVRDNSCQTHSDHAFKSYKLLQPGGDGMYLTAYRKVNCWPMGIPHSCADARWAGECYDSVDDDGGGANALGSMMWPECGSW